jgi:hypothetical protein
MNLSVIKTNRPAATAPAIGNPTSATNPKKSILYTSSLRASIYRVFGKKVSAFLKKQLTAPPVGAILYT